MDEDLKRLVHRLAGRTAIYMISKQRYPDLAERALEYVQDRGAVGLLLEQLENGIDVEQVATSYWSSRIEATAARLEDIVTAMLLGLVTTVVGGILVEAWKGEWGLLGREFREGDKEALRRLKRQEPTMRRDFDRLFPLYQTKMTGRGVADQVIAARVFQAVRNGATFEDIAAVVPGSVSAITDPQILTYLEQIASGVIKTEFSRKQDESSRYFLEREALSLSPQFAFGETLPLFDTDDLGLGPEWPVILERKFLTSQLYPDLWPAGTATDEPSPKVLILDEGVFGRIRKAGFERLLLSVVGIITMNSGMVSHLGVMTRSLGIASLCYALTDVERATAKFALLRDNRLQIYKDVPSLRAEDFNHLVRIMQAGRYSRSLRGS